ncbi:RDD family protein [Streptomyces sp. NPDC051993]|uniref:RDD family protein n=1 Tax=Streptomyces sp. NPDC051993 TaxID=3155286 RepID=UPI00341A71EB
MESKDLFGVVREPRGSRDLAPVPASMARRYGAAAIDGALAIVSGGISGLLYVITFPASEAPPLTDGALWVRILAVGIGLSLVNQVLLVLLFRGSVGKLIVGTRVVRMADGGRARPWQLLIRWVGGIAYGLTILPLGFILGGSEAPPLDFAGVCIADTPARASARPGHFVT